MRQVQFSDVDWDKVIFCSDCKKFYDFATGEHIDVPYESMPAEAAIQLMLMRNGSLLKHPKMKGVNARKPRRNKRGFGKRD